MELNQTEFTLAMEQNQTDCGLASEQNQTECKAESNRVCLAMGPNQTECGLATELNQTQFGLAIKLNQTECGLAISIKSLVTVVHDKGFEIVGSSEYFLRTPQLCMTKAFKSSALPSTFGNHTEQVLSHMDLAMELN